MGSVMPMGMNMGDDFYTQMMQYQLLNGGGANGATGGMPNGWALPQSAQSAQTTAQTATKEKAGFGGALKWGLCTAAATGAGTYFTNTSFTSPVVDGKFTDAFMTKFSGEYAAMQNGDSIKNFFKGLGTSKTPITAENYFGAMDSIEEFIRSGDVDDLTTEAKQILKKKLSLKDLKKDTLTQIEKDKLRGVVFENHSQLGKLNTTNNLNATQGLLSSLDDIGDAWKDLGKGADSKFAKINFLKENAQALGINADDYKTLLQNADDIIDVDALDNMFKKYGTGDALKTRKANLGKEVKTIQSQMQKFATKWEKSELFGVGGFKKGAGNSKVVGVLDDAYKAMKKCKAGKYALIAGVAVAGLKLLDII